MIWHNPIKYILPKRIVPSPVRIGYFAVLWLAVGMTLQASAGSPPVVSNVVAVQRAHTGLVDVNYTLVDPDSPLVSVTLFYSTDGGATWTTQCQTVWGDVGVGVVPGSGKKAVWDAGVDIPDHIDSGFTIRVDADDEIVILPSLVLIPAGTFVMGTPQSDPYYLAEQVEHTVTLTRSFYMTATEVTRTEYLDLIGSLPTNNEDCADCPVRTVTWYMAIAYCNAKSAQDGLTPAYDGVYPNWQWNQAANGWRLPTEAEWEYAYRAGTTTPYYTGWCISSDTDANFNGEGDPYPGCATGVFRGGPMPVGSFPPNPWGLYDMAGNHYEWCWDIYAPYSPEPAIDPSGAPAGSTRIWRGGNYSHAANNCRASYRLHAVPSWELNLSFRVVRWAE